MSRIEAIFLLIKCHPLAKRLVTQGVNIEANRDEEKALDGFSKVWVSGLLEGYSIQRLAGLSSNEINCLTIKMMKEVTQQFNPTYELAAIGY